MDLTNISKKGESALTFLLFIILLIIFSNDKEKRTMKPTLFYSLLIAGTLALISTFSYFSYYDYGNRSDKKVAALYEKNQNLLSQYSNKIGEMAQVPGMYTKDLKSLYTDAMTGRYGEDGSKAMFQFIREVNPTVDASMYTQIQQAMEAGRDKFENAQNELVDFKRAYEIEIDGLWSGMWLKVVGFPKTPLSEYKILKSSYANEAFEEGVENGIKL